MNFQVLRSLFISLMTAFTCATVPAIAQPAVENAQAEKQLRAALNESQLTAGFGNPEVAPILDGLAKVLTETGQEDEAKEATEMARSIRAGVLPKDFDSTVEMRQN